MKIVIIPKRPAIQLVSALTTSSLRQSMLKIFSPIHKISEYQRKFIANYQISDTRIISNQLGYVSHGEHRRFSHGRFIEV